MEPVEVIAVFNEQGEVSPLSFKRGGQQYQVDKVGKQWEDDTGKHFIIYFPVEKVLELVFSGATFRWYLNQVGIVSSYG